MSISKDTSGSISLFPFILISDPEWFGPIINFLFPLLMFGLLFVLMMRKVGGPGGGGGPGGIFNIGKSKAHYLIRAPG